MFPTHLSRFKWDTQKATATDILSRFSTCASTTCPFHLNGWMPWFAFAEYAMDTGNDPAELQQKILRQLQTPNQCAWLLFYDWDRGSHHDDPNYYVDVLDFTKLYEKGLTYESGSVRKLLRELEQLSPTKKFFQMNLWAWWLSSCVRNQCQHAQILPMERCWLTWWVEGQNLSRTCNVNWNQLVPILLKVKGTDTHRLYDCPDTLRCDLHCSWAWTWTRCHHDTLNKLRL